MLNKLNSVLLSNDVVDNFLNEYKNSDFRMWLNSILPEVEDCKNMNQDNPWHIYNCLDHILHSVEHMNTLTKNVSEEDRRMLAYAMFLHDIGKPECKIRRYSKLYGREVDSFFNHNKAGVKIADRVLCEFGFDKTQVEKIKMLIEEHDMFMFLSLKDDGNKFHKVVSDDVIHKEIEKLNKVGNGNELMQYLIWVGESDNMAQNPEMTAGSLHLIKVMNDMLRCQENVM